MARLARCRGCKKPVEFFYSPFTENVRTFDPTPVAASHPLAGVKAFPVLSRHAYRPADLVVVLQHQRSCSDVEARAEISDMPWHLLHECPQTTHPDKDVA